MTTYTFDLETQTGILNKRKASPFHPDNYIVAAGWKASDGPATGVYFSSKEESEKFVLPIPDDCTILVGFNIKFDLLWTWQQASVKAFFKRGGRVWDCQYVQYLLEGQSQASQMCSMDSIIESYGGSLKIDAVKELWNQGVNTSEIPEDLLMDYLLGNPDEEIDGDVNNTYAIFRGQAQRVRKLPPNFQLMLFDRMDGLLATTEMEFNGLYVDRERGEADRELLAARLSALDSRLAQYIPELPEGVEFNWRSIYHTSYLIYGGTLKYKKWVHNGEFTQRTEKWLVADDDAIVDPRDCEVVAEGHIVHTPSGERIKQTKSGKNKGAYKSRMKKMDDKTRPKGKQQDFFFKFPGYTTPSAAWKSTCLDGAGMAIYSTASDIIEQLAMRNIPFLKDLGDRARSQKDLGTYYWTYDAKKDARTGMLTLVGEDSIIHHQLHHTSTVTTRLSSSNPNGQNLPRGDKSTARAMFRSRFTDGKMVEVDYSQLEVVVQAVLSKDPQLILDLLAGVDFHCKRLAAKLAEDYQAVVDICKNPDHTEHDRYALMRTAIKAFTFALAYGGGAASIAASTGMSVEEVQQLIQVEHELYPGVLQFDKEVEASINVTRRPTRIRTFVAGQEFQIAVGDWVAPTGTLYRWKEGPTPAFMHKHGKFVGFSPTERKNWPVQGTGGEIVQAMLGKVWRWFVANDNFDGLALLVNTVHDCAWADTDPSVTNTVAAGMKAIMEAVPQYYNTRYGMNITVPFPCAVETGPNLLDMHS